VQIVTETGLVHCARWPRIAQSELK